MTIDRVVFTNETFQTTMETTKALKSAVEAQKEQMKNINIDELEDLRDEMSEMQYDSQQIQDLLSRNYDIEADESELDAELQALDDDIYMEALEKEKYSQKQGQSKNMISMNSSAHSNLDPYSDVLSKINNQ